MNLNHCGTLFYSLNYSRVTGKPEVTNSSKIRAVCANERSYGSVRGAISDDRPYRDLAEAFGGEALVLGVSPPILPLLNLRQDRMGSYANI